METQILLSVAGISLVAICCQWIAWWARLPAILFLLIAGVLLGPTTGLIVPDELFSDWLFPVISLSVAVILFEGSLTLKFDEIRNLKDVVRKLISIGALVTGVIVTFATHYIFALDWQLSILFGALMVVTGPTVIVPMLRTVKPTASVANILRWEGIVIDPIGALLVVVMYEFIIAGSQESAVGHSLFYFAKVIGFGTLIGAVAGYVLGFLLKRHLIPEYLESLFALSLLLAIFVLSDYLAHESGLLAVTVMGMWLANTKDLRMQDIINFKEHLSLLLISWLFIILAARLDFNQVIEMGWAPVWLFLIVQFIARPLSVLVSTWGSALSVNERILLAWIAPRGIVAAAISALFAIKLTHAGFEQAHMLVPLTFIIIVGTVVFQSATSRYLAKALGVTEPSPTGCLIIGANTVARSVAEALHKQGLQVLLIDSNWSHISKARMLGLDTFYGNPISDYTEQRIELTGIGHALALSPQKDLNALGCMHYKNEFGSKNVFAIHTSQSLNVSEKHQASEEHTGLRLFNENLAFGQFASALSNGAEIKTTKLTEEYRFDNFIENTPDAQPLMRVNANGKLSFCLCSEEFVTEPGDTLFSLVAMRGHETT